MFSVIKMPLISSYEMQFFRFMYSFLEDSFIDSYPEIVFDDSLAPKSLPEY